MNAYFDHAATTPLRPEAAAAMSSWYGEHFGNPSGSHSVSHVARRAVEGGRQTMAEALGCDPGEVVFTSGGTESDNLAVAGTIGHRGGIPVCSAIEHHAVLLRVQAMGGRVVEVGPTGQIDTDALARVLTEVADEGKTVGVVSVMMVNNETGTIQDLSAVAKVVQRLAPGAALHTDAVQAFPWLNVAALAAPAHLISISAHKFGGPQGVGALVVRSGTEIEPLNMGGGQERDRRSGTHNVAGILGMAAAARVTVDTRPETAARVGRERDRLADGLLAAVPGAVETGHRADKTPGHCHLRFPGVESEEILALLDEAGICASAGSACASGALDPSHVLLAMGIDPTDALSSLRLSLGAQTSGPEVDEALKVIPDVVASLRRRP
ncbi:MAG: cysteine desulfurase family protein [Acidimicrobiales bacterium]